MSADGISEPRDAATPRAADPTQRALQTENTAVRVVFFSDLKGSTALKQDMAEKWDEDRDRAGEIIKSTGDGFLAIFRKPSTAVERALEIHQEPCRLERARFLPREAG